MNENTKQVIVIRADLNMRKGKIAAQASHASMSFLTKSGSTVFDDHHWAYYRTSNFNKDWVYELAHWLNNSFRKICVYVNSQEELEAVHQKALDSGLISHLIIDNGATEFNGVPTMTCCAIGPAWGCKFKDITDHLPLL